MSSVTDIEGGLIYTELAGTLITVPEGVNLHCGADAATGVESLNASPAGGFRH